MQTEVISEGKIQEKRGISSAVLKNIAVVTMLIDHIGAVIVTRLLIRNGLYEAMANQEAYTALLGLLVIAGLHLVEQHFVGTTVGKTILRVGLNAVIILTGCVLGLVLKTDYDFKGILAITVLYLFRNRKKAQMWAGVIIFLLMDSLEMFAALSFILIWFYNGTRGRQNKYFFYFFYPAHLLLLWLVCVAMGIAGIPAI